MCVCVLCDQMATTVFFLNVYNSLMLHSHFHRRTAPLENLKPIRHRLVKMFQYQVPVCPFSHVPPTRPMQAPPLRA